VLRRHLTRRPEEHGQSDPEFTTDEKRVGFITDAFGGKRRVCRTCVVELDGRSFSVDDPKVVPVDEVMALLFPLLVRIVRWHETEHALLLHIAEPAERLSA
jgi:hypothetical protein